MRRQSSREGARRVQKYKRTQGRRAGPSPSFIYHYDGERNHQGLGNAFVFLDTTALAMLCRSVLSSAEYHNRKEMEIGTVSLKKGELVDFEAHLVGRSRNAAKPRVKRGRKSTLTADRMEKLLGCVRRGLSNKDARMVAGISETTFYRWKYWLLWQDWANSARLWRNLVNVQQSPWYMYRPL